MFHPAARWIPVAVHLLAAACAAHAVDPAGGFGGGPVSGTLTVAAVDEWTGGPIEGAFVQVGPAPGFPFPDNSGWTGSTGSITFTDAALSGPQIVTVGKEGYSFATVFEVDAATIALPIRPRGTPLYRPQYSGDITSGFNIVWNDGQFDVALAWHTLPIRDILPMIEDISSGRFERIAPQVIEEFPLIGDQHLPGAIYLPFQIELLFYPVERTPYVIYVEDQTVTDLWAIYGRIPVFTVLDELVKPEPDLFRLISEFDIRRYGLAEGIVVNGPGTRDFGLTIESGQDVHIPIAGTAPGLNVLVSAVADLDGLSGAGRLFPCAFAAVPGGGDTLLSLPTLGTGMAGAPDYIFGVVQSDTTEVLGSSAFIDRAGLAPGGTAELTSFFQFTSLAVSETLFAWTAVANPEAGLFPDVHQATISWVRAEPDTNVWAEPGDSIEVAELLWTFHLDGAATGFALPQLAGQAPAPILDPDTSSQVDRLAASVTGFRIGAGPDVFDYDDWDLADRSSYGTHFCGNTVDSIPPPHAPAVSVGEREGAIERELSLGAPRPNPFRAETVIRLALPVSGGGARLAVYDMSGRRVRDFSSQLMPGQSAIVWDGLSDGGPRVPSGAYLMRLDTEKGTVTRKLILTR